MATRLMHRLLVRLDEELGISRASARIFCNSRLPEKPLCIAAGLASLATNGLCVAAGLGSLFVIAGAIIPRPLPEVASLRPSATHGECGTCRRCIDACPAGAILSAGVVDRSRCLASLAARPDVLPPEIMEKWGVRLYGCQDCQSVCPRNRELHEEAPDACGEIGPSVSLRWLLSLDARRLEELFHGTAMGLSWISKEALLRNAVIAAGNRGAATLREGVASLADSDVQPISAAARWAIQKIRKTKETEDAERNARLPDA